jgi:hypothetical protein
MPFIDQASNMIITAMTRVLAPSVHALRPTSRVMRPCDKPRTSAMIDPITLTQMSTLVESAPAKAVLALSEKVIVVGASSS